MKKITLIILFAVASICSFGQTTEDQTQILQKCIDLSELQQLYQPNEQVYVLQHHPVFYPSGLPVKKFNKELKHLSPTELLELSPNGYLLFKKFEVKVDVSQVLYEYNYKAGGNLKTLAIELNFKKEGESWNISQKNIK